MSSSGQTSRFTSGGVIRTADADSLALAVGALHAGDLVAFPTETVYGLGADATNPSAVAAIFDLKGRPRFDPLIVHAADTVSALNLCGHVPPAAQRLADHFWPGALTLVLPRGQAPLADLVSAGLPTVGIRVPAHSVATALLRAVGCPLAAPSANRFGRTSPTTAAAVADEFPTGLALILDGGPCQVGVESTVVGWPDGSDAPPVVMRLGGVTVEALTAVVGPVGVWSRSRSDLGLSRREPSTTDAASSLPPGLPSPGLLDRHYAPATPMILLDEFAHLGPPPPVGSPPAISAGLPGPLRLGLLCLAEPPGWQGAFAVVEQLAPDGDLVSAAAKLFAALRRLDSAGCDSLVALPVPNTGLGRAINDRLRRASHSVEGEMA